MAAKKVAGTATGMALSIPGVDLDALDAVMGTATADYRAGQIADISIPLLDRDGKLAPSLNEGATAYLGDDLFQIAAQERDYRAEGLALTLSLRSWLAQRLRDDKGPRTTKGITPQAWITRRVTAAGGTAVVQPGAKRQAIVQKRSQSALAVIEDLASSTNTTWVEHSNRLYVGTPWWAYQGETGLPTWELPLTSEAAMAFVARNSKSDDTNAATASLTVPNEVARRLRPWHRLVISRAAAADNGVWLIEGVTYQFDRNPGEIELTRPRKSSVQNGSSSTAGEDANPSDGYSGTWVPGADKVWPGCNQTPRQMVKSAYGYKGQARWSGQCQTFISYLANKPYSGGPYYAKDSWYNMLKRAPQTPHGTERDAPAGALVVWNNGTAGHIAISVGNGRMISTTGSTIQEIPIDSYVNMSYYLGWMAPAQYK